MLQQTVHFKQTTTESAVRDINLKTIKCFISSIHTFTTQMCPWILETYPIPNASETMKLKSQGKFGDVNCENV